MVQARHRVPVQPDILMPPRNWPIDDEAQPVMVPRNGKGLAPVSPERVRRLRGHLERLSGAARDPDTLAPVRPEPDGFAAEVARAACTLCQGWCCKNGGDDAFLDERTIARTRHAYLASDPDAVPRMYLELVPEIGYEGSCIFHGKQGCTLTRAMRSDVCNSYFCGGLQSYLTSGDLAAPAAVIAGEGGGMRTAPVLWPKAARKD